MPHNQRPDQNKLKQFCENTFLGICRYLNITANGTKICIKDTKLAEEISGPANCCQQNASSPIKPPCKHSANPLKDQPGELQCRSCRQIRKCEHPIISHDQHCLICGKKIN